MHAEIKEIGLSLRVDQFYCMDNPYGVEDPEDTTEYIEEEKSAHHVHNAMEPGMIGIWYLSSSPSSSPEPELRPPIKEA